MKRKQYKIVDEVNWPSYIGKDIEKHSGKPFKCGLKVVKVVSLTTNSNTNKPAFLVSDGSIVDCYQCKLK